MGVELSVSMGREMTLGRLQIRGNESHCRIFFLMANAYPVTFVGALGVNVRWCVCTWPISQRNS